MIPSFNQEAVILFEYDGWMPGEAEPVRDKGFVIFSLLWDQWEILDPAGVPAREAGALPAAYGNGNEKADMLLLAENLQAKLQPPDEGAPVTLQVNCVMAAGEADEPVGLPYLKEPVMLYDARPAEGVRSVDHLAVQEVFYTADHTQAIVLFSCAVCPEGAAEAVEEQGFVIVDVLNDNVSILQV